MKKTKKFTKQQIPPAKAILFASAAGIVAELLFSLIFAAFLQKSPCPENYYGILSIVIPILSAFSAGMFCSVLSKQNGLLRGIVVGMIISSAFVLAGFLLPSESASLTNAFLRLGLTVLSGGFGGFLGICLISRR